ncbi:MAG: TolC family protein, partial [Betaproteobacteria bacterium]
MSIRQFIFYTACAFSLSAAAQTASPASSGRSGPVSLAQALQAAKANAQARLAQQSLAAASADILAADRPPLPVFSAKAASTSDNSGSQPRYDKSVGLDWTVERGDKRLHRTAAAKFGAQAAQSELAETLLLQQMQAKDLFFDLLAAQERVLHLQGIAQAAEQTAGAARLRLRAGDLSAQDTVRVEIEAERARSDLAKAQAEQKRASLTLAQGLGWPGSAASPLSAQADWPDAGADMLALTASVEAWMATRPDIKAYELRAAAAQAALDNARALGKIDPTVGLSVDSSGAANRRLAELRVQFPLQVRSTYD